MGSLIVKNASAIVTCDGNNTVLYDADLVIEDGFIVALGKGAADAYPLETQTIDASGHFIYPGLVNTHHHFFQAFVRNQRELDWTTLSLVEWLKRIYQIFTLIDEDCIYHSSMVSMADLVKHGCTTAFDHQYCFNDHAGKYLIDRQFEAAHKIGMRFVAGRGTNTLPASAGSTMPDSMVESTDEYLKDCERLLHKYHNGNPGSMRQVALAPCQPINCHRETFTESLQLARLYQANLHTHLSEGENALMQERHGLRSLDWCEEVGFFGADVWIAHGWEMTAAEMQQLQRLNIGLAHCPAPMYLVGDGITNLNAAYAAGVRIGLGVDGQASNDNSNPLESIRLAYLGQCLAANERSLPAPPAESFLHFATRGGASLLNRPDLGSLAVNQAADFFSIDSRRLDLVGATHDPELLPVRVGINQEVDLTVINGNVIWRDGQFTHIDERQCAEQANRVFHQRIFNSSTMQQMKHLT